MLFIGTHVPDEDIIIYLLYASSTAKLIAGALIQGSEVWFLSAV